MNWESFEYTSGFASDIRDMLAFKTALGRKASSFAADLLCFDRFCANAYPNDIVLTQEIALAWCMDGRKQKAAPHRMEKIRGFGEYLVTVGKPAYVLPTALIPKRKAELPYLLTDSELKKFFAATDNYPHRINSPLLEYTVAVIFRLIYACGLRPQEARRLQRKDFDFKKSTIYIEESKWCKDRRLVVDASMMALCRKYDTIAHDYFPDRTVFFPNRNGMMYGHERLTEMFHQCWELSGIGDARGSCVPYDLRHNFATRTMMRWISDGKDLDACIPYLCAYMGHASFHSTYYYVHLLPEKLGAMDFMKPNGIIPEVPNEI